MAELRLTLGGMHCASCAMLIEDELEELDGVHMASASYPRQRAEVSFDDRRIGSAAILETVGRLGYEARVAD